MRRPAARAALKVNIEGWTQSQASSIKSFHPSIQTLQWIFHVEFDPFRISPSVSRRNFVLARSFYPTAAQHCSKISEQTLNVWVSSSPWQPSRHRLVSLLFPRVNIAIDRTAYLTRQTCQILFSAMPYHVKHKHPLLFPPSRLHRDLQQIASAAPRWLACSMRR